MSQQIEIKMSISDAYTLGHLIRQDLMANNPNVLSAHVQTEETLNEETDGRLVIQMLPGASQSPQVAYRESIQRIITQFRNMLNGPD